ncbi:MAG: DUF4864 domain-containing protein [Roseibium sp.]|nr:DUF4864 domain-containing protein [Roseibium sp.]
MTFIRFVRAFGLAVCLLAGPMFASAFVGSSAAQASDVDSAAFQSIIRGQMNAFRTGDAAKAFSYATPVLQKRFQTPEIFIHMVKTGYLPVYRPTNVTFGQSRMTPHGPMQEVYVTDPGGENWLALYSFEKQGDGTWRISGCFLQKAKGFDA